MNDFFYLKNIHKYVFCLEQVVKILFDQPFY